MALVIAINIDPLLLGLILAFHVGTSGDVIISKHRVFSTFMTMFFVYIKKITEGDSVQAF